MFIPIQQLHLAQQVNNNFFFSILEIFGKQINRVSFFKIKTNSHQIHYSASQGTIHILRNHFFRIFGPPPPLRNHVFSTENNQKLAFSDPPPPLQVIT